MKHKAEYIYGIVMLILWIVLLVKVMSIEAQDDCAEYYDCHEAQDETSWACIVEWGWLSAEDTYEFPLIIVAPDGDYVVTDNEPSCNVEVSEDSGYTDDRRDWQSFSAAIYAGDNGAEIYCLDSEGNGQYAISLTVDTLTNTEFGCGTFYFLPDTCEYQLTLEDGVTLISDNLWFIGAYYGDSNTHGVVDGSCVMVDGTDADISTDDSDVTIGATG